MDRRPRTDSWRRSTTNHLPATRSSAPRKASLDRMLASPYPGATSISQDDIVAVGGDLEPATLIGAYRRGVFPWPVEALPLLWFFPRERAILVFDQVHIPRRLARTRRRTS